jgi:hypothetical protein
MYTDGHEGRSHGVAASTKDAVSADRRVGGSASLQPRRSNSEGKVKFAVRPFLDMPRRIAQERVPTASNVGSRDVAWVSQPTPLIPFRDFSRVSRADSSG